MTFVWRYETAVGAAVEDGALPQTTFTTQADAESWIGEHWQELLDAGVDQVSLLDGERTVYAAMSLHPAD